MTSLPDDRCNAAPSSKQCRRRASERARTTARLGALHPYSIHTCFSLAPIRDDRGAARLGRASRFRQSGRCRLRRLAWRKRLLRWPRAAWRSQVAWRRLERRKPRRSLRRSCKRAVRSAHRHHHRPNHPPENAARRKGKAWTVQVPAWRGELQRMAALCCHERRGGAPRRQALSRCRPPPGRLLAACLPPPLTRTLLASALRTAESSASQPAQAASS